ncbi:MAG: acyl-CoA dehydratase activase-related protein [Lawsonibacter sp.]
MDFIIDIGGQDMKCFKIRNGAVDSIMLNEACSSGCGSFIETFAKALGYNIADFSKLGLFAQHPVNSGLPVHRVHELQRQAGPEGRGRRGGHLRRSVHLHREERHLQGHPGRQRRRSGTAHCGQGGTFLNDAVLRAFELELGRDVTRPTISGIMGAFGAALAARDLHLDQSPALLAPEALDRPSPTPPDPLPAACAPTTAPSPSTALTAGGGSSPATACSRPLGEEPDRSARPDDATSTTYLRSLHGKGQGDGSRGRIGIPFGLNMYENLPFWFESVHHDSTLRWSSPPSPAAKLYLKGQRTIPSDTVCYPPSCSTAMWRRWWRRAWTPSSTPVCPITSTRSVGDNNYNCPVVAYYPELLAANVPDLKQIRFLYPYFGLHRPKDFEQQGRRVVLQTEFQIPKRETVGRRQGGLRRLRCL